MFFVHFCAMVHHAAHSRRSKSMIDRQVQQLLQQAVDTPVKLHLVVIFYEHPVLQVTPAWMAQHTCRDIWSVTEALLELAEDGILEVSQVAGELTYCYRPHPEYIQPIATLIRDYNDPLARKTLRRSLQDVAPHALLRRSGALQRRSS
jgi:hypothetical protein